MVRIGLIGHRYLGNTEVTTFVAEQCSAILKQAQIEHTDVIAFSAIAEGADTLFAEAALALDIPLKVVRPFKEYTSDFTTFSARKRYDRLRAAAHSETKLSYITRSDKAYLAAMNWVVEHSDVLIAAWDGLPSVVVGGTGDAIKRAILTDRAWIHLNVVNLSVAFHSVKLATKQ